MNTERDAAHGWAQIGGDTGTNGTMNQSESVMTSTQFITVASGIGAGIGASGAIQADLAAAAAAAAAGTTGATLTGSALVTVTGAAIGGLASSFVAGFALGEVLNKTEFIQDLQMKAADLAYEALHGNPLDHIRILNPDVTVNGPWAVTVDKTPAAPHDNVEWFTCQPGDSSITLYDTPLDLINSNTAFSLDAPIFCLYTLP